MDDEDEILSTGENLAFLVPEESVSGDPVTEDIIDIVEKEID